MLEGPCNTAARGIPTGGAYRVKRSAKEKRKDVL